MGESQPSVRRERTAIRRYRCSRPVSLALADGVIQPGQSFLDFGCGHGTDVRFLQSKGVEACGWDPHYAPDPAALRPADVVNLGYVLNVIEDAEERSRVLRSAYLLARAALVVSVRVDRTFAAVEAEELADGVLTGRGTFQKIFTQGEFRDYLDSTLGTRVQFASLGVAYVFKIAEAEQAFLANRAFSNRLEYRTELLEEFGRNRVAKKFVQLANQLGRAPLPEEFPAYDRLLEAFGSPERIARLLLAHVDRQEFEGVRSARREDILTYLAMLRLRGLTPPPLGVLPASIQQDIKACWGSYTSARAEAERFLFSMGSPDAVAAAIAASGVGKLLPKDLYVHRSAEPELPALVRLVVFAAQQIVGRVEYDVLKIARDGRAVSFLAYESFDHIAHPALTESVRIYLPKSEYDIRDYRGAVNPPILHRKETLVSRSYPRFAEFELLTRQEEDLELLSAPEIGHRQQWLEVLSARGVTIEGHTLRMATNLAASEPAGIGKEARVGEQ